MHSIALEEISKRYAYQKIIADFNYRFTSDKVYGISGYNGSGKSTLIKMLSGYLSPSLGKITYTIHGQIVTTSHIFRSISLTAPYTDLVQEYELKELYDFHMTFKSWREDLTFTAFLERLEMPKTQGKSIGQFSSGMKQKIQLALSIWADTPILLLDEPTSFLDEKARAWFVHQLTTYKKDRIVIIASNDLFDLRLCDETVHL
jgi:ABC-type multidrug transport system ATPase subunit